MIKFGYTYSIRMRSIGGLRTRMRNVIDLFVRVHCVNSKTFNATGSLCNSSLIFESGSEIDEVVSIKLEPQFDSHNNIEVVCVTNIQAVGNLMIE